MAFASSSRKTNAGSETETQRNSKFTSANKFSPLVLKMTSEQPKCNAYPKRDRKLTTRAVESEEQNKKKKAINFDLNQFVLPPPNSINDHFLEC